MASRVLCTAAFIMVMVCAWAVDLEDSATAVDETLTLLSDDEEDTSEVLDSDRVLDPPSAGTSEGASGGVQDLPMSFAEAQILAKVEADRLEHANAALEDANVDSAAANQEALAAKEVALKTHSTLTSTQLNASEASTILDDAQEEAEHAHKKVAEAKQNMTEGDASMKRAEEAAAAAASAMSAVKSEEEYAEQQHESAEKAYAEARESVTKALEKEMETEKNVTKYKMEETVSQESNPEANTTLNDEWRAYYNETYHAAKEKATKAHAHYSVANASFRVQATHLHAAQVDHWSAEEHEVESVQHHAAAKEDEASAKVHEALMKTAEARAKKQVLDAEEATNKEVEVKHQESHDTAPASSDNTEPAPQSALACPAGFKEVERDAADYTPCTEVTIHNYTLHVQELDCVCIDGCTCGESSNQAYAALFNAFCLDENVPEAIKMELVNASQVCYTKYLGHRKKVSANVSKAAGCGEETTQDTDNTPPTTVVSMEGCNLQTASRRLGEELDVVNVARLHESMKSTLGEHLWVKTARATVCSKLSAQSHVADTECLVHSPAGDEYTVLKEGGINCKDRSVKSRADGWNTCSDKERAAVSYLGESNAPVTKWPTPQGHVNALDDPDVRKQLEALIEEEMNKVEFPLIRDPEEGNGIIKHPPMYGWKWPNASLTGKYRPGMCDAASCDRNEPGCSQVAPPTMSDEEKTEDETGTKSVIEMFTGDWCPHLQRLCTGVGIAGFPKTQYFGGLHWADEFNGGKSWNSVCEFWKVTGECGTNFTHVPGVDQVTSHVQKMCPNTCSGQGTDVCSKPFSIRNEFLRDICPIPDDMPEHARMAWIAPCGCYRQGFCAMIKITRGPSADGTPLVAGWSEISQPATSFGTAQDACTPPEPAVAVNSTPWFDNDKEECKETAQNDKERAICDFQCNPEAITNTALAGVSDGTHRVGNSGLTYGFDPPNAFYNTRRGQSSIAMFEKTYSHRPDYKFQFAIQAPIQACTDIKENGDSIIRKAVANLRFSIGREQVGLSSTQAWDVFKANVEERKQKQQEASTAKEASFKAQFTAEKEAKNKEKADKIAAIGAAQELEEKQFAAQENSAKENAQKNPPPPPPPPQPMRCLEKGTPVATVTGTGINRKISSKAIEDIRPRDVVMSFDASSNKFLERAVARLNQNPEFVHHSFFRSTTTQELHAVVHTPGHRFFLPAKGSWGTTEHPEEWVQRHAAPQHWSADKLDTALLNNAELMEPGDHVMTWGNDTVGSLVYVNSTHLMEKRQVYNLDLEGSAHTFLAHGIVVDAIAGIWKCAGQATAPPMGWYFNQSKGDIPPYC